jgi:long-chain acyl-CoA synthetase
VSSYLTQPLRRAAQVNRNGTATVCGERRYSWSEVLDRVARLGGALHHLGLGDGGRVAVLAMNSDRYFELYSAVPWAGGAIVPLNTRLAAAEIAYIVEDSAPDILLADSVGVQLLQSGKLCAGMRARVYMGDGPAPADWLGYEDLIAAFEPAPDAGRHGSDLAGIFYTGGSTGKAKGVMLSHDNLVTNAMNALYLVGYDKFSVYLHAGPMFHLADGMATFSLTMIGGTHVFIPKFEVTQCLAAMAAHKVTHLTLVPTMITMLLDGLGVENLDLSSLQQIQFGSSPMPDATLRRAVALWPDIRFLHGWGMTETSPIGTIMPSELRRPAVAGNKLRSCGQGPLNGEVMIVDETGREVSRGTVGELIIRGPMVMLGYWNKPSETAAAVRDGWMHTGDAAYMDEDGLVYIVDRLKDMIISGGENVYSIEVENAISLIPGVAEVAVIGLPHERWGESVHAVVVLRQGATLNEEMIREHCRSVIAGYKVPRSVEIRADPLPLTGAGKIFKRALRESYGQGAARPSTSGSRLIRNPGD